MVIYESAILTAKEPFVKPAERHKHKNGANIQKENTKLTKQNNALVSAGTKSIRHVSDLSPRHLMSGASQ